ncbi:MAG: DUF6531 domain-containing protein [Bdellovibrionota bacterium]
MTFGSRTIFLALILATYPIAAQENQLGWGPSGTLHYIHHAPDPVQTRNGNFFLPMQDYYLPCFSFPLEVYRSYNSLSSRQGPFGKGWTFNFDSKIAVSKGKGLQVVEADGFVNEYLPQEYVNGDRSKIIALIVSAKQEEDKRYGSAPSATQKSVYQDFEKKLREDSEFFDRQAQRYAKNQMYLSPSKTYVSSNRGKTVIKETSAGYQRSSETGRTELFNGRGLLARVFDANGNELRMVYDNMSRLQRVYDGCKNYLQIDYNQDGKIVSIKDSFHRSMSYSYKKQGQDILLASMTSVDGKKESYEYDELGQMTVLTYQGGGSTTIKYDKKSRKVLEQVGPGTKKTTYDYGRDGKTQWCKIKDNQGENSTYEYIDSESKVSYTDRSGVTTTTILSTCCGKPISVTSTNGIKDKYQYDDQGRITSKTNNKGEITTFVYDDHSGYLSKVIGSDGDEVSYRYDKNNNLSYAMQKTKNSKTASSWLKIYYEQHGKIARIEDHKQQQILFSYSELGIPTKVEKMINNKVVAQILVSNSKMGEIVGVTLNPKTPSTQTEIRNTLSGYAEILGPTGLDFEF